MTILHLNHVSLRFADTEKPAVNQIDLIINPGDFIILLGSNGSGKSTLLKLLHRHYQPSQGHIQFLGTPMEKYNDKILNRHIAVLTQNCIDSLFPSLTLYENYSVTHKKPGSRQFLINYLNDYNPNLSYKLDVVVNQLSGGEKQALALALTLLQPPTLLLLDEHTSALDPKTSDQIMQTTQKMVTKHNITCVLTTHDLDIAMQYGNKILVLREGRIHKIFDHKEKRQLSKEKLIANCYE